MNCKTRSVVAVVACGGVLGVALWMGLYGGDAAYGSALSAAEMAQTYGAECRCFQGDVMFPCTADLPYPCQCPMDPGDACGAMLHVLNNWIKEDCRETEYGNGYVCYEEYVDCEQIYACAKQIRENYVCEDTGLYTECVADAQSSCAMCGPADPEPMGRSWFEECR